MSIELWLGFMAACWLISLSPGAGAIASMSSGLKYGFAHGYYNAIGLQIALILQITIVAMGVGALVANTAWAASLIKWFGVAYLLYLAYGQWHAPVVDFALQSESRRVSRSHLLLSGFLVNITNPKALIFLLAILPQFLDLTRPTGIQYVQMTITMVSIDLLVMAAYTVLAANVLRLLRSPKQQKLINRAFAVLFLMAALILMRFS